MNVCFRADGEGKEIYWPRSLLLSLFLSYFPFFLISCSFLKKKTQQQKKKRQKKNITMPLNKSCCGQQWILRTYRKAGISWYIPALSGQLTTLGRGERTWGLVWEKGLLHCSIFALLSWHFYSFGSRIPVCKRFRRTWLENLIVYVGQLHVITREENLCSDNTSICDWHCPGN